MTPLRLDIAARDARERAELAATTRDGVLALEACSQLSELFAAGYRITALAEPRAVAPRPVLLRARSEGSCIVCGDPFVAGDSIWWTRGAQGVECGACGAPR